MDLIIKVNFKIMHKMLIIDMQICEKKRRKINNLHIDKIDCYYIF